VLEHVLLQADHGLVTRTTTDLSVFEQATVPATITGPGRILVPVRRQAEGVSKGRGAVAFDGPRIRVDPAAFTIPTLDPDKIPVAPEKSTHIGVILSGHELTRLLKRVGYCMGTDDTRKHLYGAFLERQDDVLRLVATDGYRMAIASKNDLGADFGVIVHRRGVGILLKVFDDRRDVWIYRTAERVWFDAKVACVSAKLVDDTYPVWRQVVPSSSTSRAIIERVPMLAALKAVATGDVEGVRLDLDPTSSTVAVSSRDDEGKQQACSDGLVARQRVRAHRNPTRLLPPVGVSKFRDADRRPVTSA
jgi:DNA polymerase-3 subunit beta